MPKVERVYAPGQFVRVYHHYEKLEEYHAGMWRIVRGAERKGFVNAAADLMRQPEEFKVAMQQAVASWPVSCEFNLTAEGVNKIAWLGHAGCCVATGSPEESTRVGWHTLSHEEQAEANRVAAEVLEEWRAAYKPAEAREPDLFNIAGVPC